MIGPLADRAAAESAVWAQAALPPGRARRGAAVRARRRRRASPTAWRRSTRASSCTTPAAGCSPHRTASSACCSATTSTPAALVGVCQAGDVEAVAALADLVALAAHLRAEGDGDGDDGRLWLATARHLAGPRNGALDRAKDALRAGDRAPLRELVPAGRAGPPPARPARAADGAGGARRVSFRDLRQWIDALRRAGELVEIDAPGRPAPRDHRDRRPHDEGRRARAPLPQRARLADAAADQPVRHRAADVHGARRGAPRRGRGADRRRAWS